MQELANYILNFIFDFITIDLFRGFGFYSICYVFLNLIFKKSIWLQKFDDASVKLIIAVGLLYTCLWTLSEFLTFNGFFGEQIKASVINRISGKYWYSYWLQGLIWVIISQLLRFEKIKHSKILRFVLGVFFIISFQVYVILLTSIHRDYVSSSDNIFLQFLFGTIMDMIIYSLIVAMIMLVKKQLKKLSFVKLNNTKSMP